MSFWDGSVPKRSKLVRPRDVSQPGEIKVINNADALGELSVKFARLKSLILDAPFWLAGGAITSMMTGDKINDLDIFSSDPDAVISDLKSAGCGLEFENGHVANFMHASVDQTIQVIKRAMASPEATAAQIDLTINATAYDGNSLFVHDDLVQDIEDMKIGLNVVNYPLNTFLRVIKYAQRGFSLRPDVAVTLVKLIREAEISDLNHLSFYLEHHE
jgi:hypothetical protein